MLLEVRSLSKSYGALQVLTDVNFAVKKGEVVVILGASGSGKSTFLKCLNVLEEYDAGYVLLQGSYVGYEPDGNGRRRRQSESRRNVLRTRIGIVFQSYNLFPHLNVLDNLTLAPIQIKGESRGEVRQMAEALLERLGLAEKRYHYPSRLSGGEQQRVAIARALAMKPEIMLLDEVTSALDPQLVAEVLDFVRQLSADGMSMVIITHELGFAADVSNRVMFLANGRVDACGATKDILERPPTETLARFVGHFTRDTHRA